MSGSESIQLSQEEAESAISSFQRIITYPTVSSTAASSGAYQQCSQFIISQLKTISCFQNIGILEESPAASPVVFAKWTGIHEDWPVILLNSHYDVVPAAVSDWTVDPFAAIRKDGKIYGRGAQDMKCVCIQYIEAIRKIQIVYPSFRPQRSIYLTFVPDEEVGGAGMLAFLSSTLYKSLPGIALALDEGLASTDETYSLFYGERMPWWIDVTAIGKTGHGSRFIEGTAVEQIIAVSNKALSFRKEQRDLLHGSNLSADHSNCAHAVAVKRQNMQKIGEMTLGDVTSLNITTLEAGVKVGDTYAYNCVPPVAKCTFDIRISPHVMPSEISGMIDSWCQECSSNPQGSTVTWKGILGKVSATQKHALTSTDSRNPWYQIFESAMSNMGYKIRPQVFPAATDSRFLRELGIRAFGFSPMRNTKIMLHEDDEYLEESVFVEGIEVYANLIYTLSSSIDHAFVGIEDNKTADSELTT